jgi:hypothetical protein
LKAVIHRTGNEIDQCNLAEKCWLYMFVYVCMYSTIKKGSTSCWKDKKKSTKQTNIKRQGKFTWYIHTAMYISEIQILKVKVQTYINWKCKRYNVVFKAQ